jgi:hypothetical protein
MAPKPRQPTKVKGQTKGQKKAAQQERRKVRDGV